VIAIELADSSEDVQFAENKNNSNSVLIPKEIIKEAQTGR